MKWLILFYLKFLAISISVLTPWICYYNEGPRKALSLYWYTDMWILFLLTNIVTGYYFLTLPSWRLSGILLIGLTLFPCKDYIILHDIIAILFFIANINPIIRNKRLSKYCIPYVASFFILPFSIFWTEVLAIIVLCLYHSHSLILLKSLNTMKKYSYNK